MRHFRRLAACWMALAAPLAAQTAPGSPNGNILARPVSFSIRNATLGDALTRLRHEEDIPLAWSADLLPTDRRVSFHFTGETLALALDVMLSGSDLGVAVARDGTVVIVPKSPDPVRGGSIATAHQVTDVERVRLATGVRQLDQIVVTGSAVAGMPEREMPTAMNVVGSQRLEESPYSRVADVMRTLLPGVVLWDRGPSGPPPQVTSVRGVSSFTTRALKTYVDGVELASPDLFTLVDGRSIERIEVIRGPQGAALYGPDAINGILQIVTRKGTPGSRDAHLRGALTAGPYDRPDLPDAALYQDYGAAVTGGTGAVGIDAGGSFIQSGSSGGIPWLRTWTAQVGSRALLGPVILSGSARMGGYQYGDERATVNGTTADVPVTQTLEERGFGLTALHSVTRAWQQTLTVGRHRVNGPREASRPALLTPRLPLGATHEDATRTSLRYSSAWELPVGPQEATLSAGAEYSHRDVERLVRRSTLTRDLTPLYQDAVKSTGVFGQLRGRLAEQLVLTVGTRAEWNSSVGENEGAQWASSVGASWTQPLGTTTLRLRGAWGRGIKPPEPGMSRAMAIGTVVQLPNPDLVAESQAGVELGGELFFGEGMYARATWYNQTAEDLIQQVQIAAQAPTRSYQFQNVGAIANRGVELEGGVRWNRVRVTGLLYFVSSEVVKLAPKYSGELKPGDQLLEVPSTVGSISVRYDGGRWSAEVGGSWLGPWVGYDWMAIQQVVDGQVPARGALRNYWLDYPGVFRPYLAGSMGIGARLIAFARMENPGNNGAFIRDNISPPLGRTTVFGIELTP